MFVIRTWPTAVGIRVETFTNAGEQELKPDDFYFSFVLVGNVSPPSENVM